MQHIARTKRRIIVADIYIFGSLNMDLVINARNMPVRGETVVGEGFFANPGGKGANQAVAASKLGGKVYMSGAVGDDSFGEQMLCNLKKYGVDVSKVRTVAGCESGVAVIIVENGDNRIILNSGANAKAGRDDVENLLQNAKEKDIFLTQLENDIDVAGYALKRAKEKGMFTVLNPAPANARIKPYLKYVDLVTPNKGESELLTGEKDHVLSAEKMPVENVVITLGGEGYYYKGKGVCLKGECIKVRPVDTTAAGDTFCGALVARLANGDDMENALKYASCAASLACTKKGAQQSVPEPKDVENAMKL